MAEEVSKRISFRWQKFKRFLKRNMTPTWAKHFGYQVFAFFVAVAMVIGVAEYAITKSYDERELNFVENFTITAHSGAYGAEANSVDFVSAAIRNKARVIELDIRQRPDSTLVMSHDLVVTNKDGAPLEDALVLLENENIKINFDIKETKVLDSLYDMLVKHALVEKSFLTGIEASNIKDVKTSKCADLEYYLNYKPSRTKIFFDDYRQKLISLIEETGAVGLNCNYKYVNSQLSSLLHKKGYKLSVWTVDKQRKAKKVLVIKPDNITTKSPGMIEKVIKNWGK